MFAAVLINKFRRLGCLKSLVLAYLKFPNVPMFWFGLLPRCQCHFQLPNLEVLLHLNAVRKLFIWFNFCLTGTKILLSLEIVEVKKKIIDIRNFCLVFDQS